MIELDVQCVLDLLEHHDKFLRTLEDVVRTKIAEERRQHLTLVATEDDEEQGGDS